MMSIKNRRRQPLKPLHGPKKVRFFRGIVYPHVRSGSTFLKQVTVSLSKKNVERHGHFEDPVIVLHDGDFDLDQVKGLPLRHTHGKGVSGDIGVIDGGEINSDRQLEIWGRIYGDTDGGYDAIVAHDHGELDGLSIQFHNHIMNGTNLMLGKTLEEMSLTPTGGAHYDNCRVTVSCSKNPTTNGTDYTTNNEGKNYNNNNYKISVKERGLLHMADNNNNMSQGAVPQGNGNGQQTAPPMNNPLANQQQQPAQQQSPLNDANALGQLIKELQGQVKNENDAKKQFQDKLASNEKMMLDMQKNLKLYQDKEKKSIETKNAEILKDLPAVLNVLGNVAGIKNPAELNPKTVKMMEALWTDPEQKQFLDMTKNAALQLAELQKEKKVWEAQRKQLGLQVNSTAIAVPASKARFMLDNMREDARREELRKKKAGLTFDDVYTSSNIQESDNPFGSRYNGLLSGDNYGSWGSDMQITPNIPMSVAPGVPIVQPRHTTRSTSFSMGVNNSTTRSIPVGASAPPQRQQRQQQQQMPYTAHQTNAFPSSMNRFGWGKSQFNDTLSMDLKSARALCTVTVHKGEAPMYDGDKF